MTIMADRGISVLIAGEAGQGTDSSGRHIAEFFSENGLWTFMHRDYQSVIRGGHSFAIVKASDEEIFAADNEVDVIIALNSESLKHSSQLKKDGLIICAKACPEIKGFKTISMPFSDIEQKWSKIFLNSACISAFLTAKGYDFKDFVKLFKKKQKENFEVMQFAAEYVKKNYPRFIESKKASGKSKGPVVSGNQAIAQGLIGAGLERYYAYPMTPATGILDYLALNQKNFGLALQPENEISVINMALGSAYAGKISAVGTSGGGFDLMHEALSMAGLAEIPILVIEAQRGSSSTGLPTYSGQADLLSVIYSGHGEFPRIVAAPATTEEAYELSAELLKLAWKYQVVSILLSDKNVSESYKTTNFSNIQKLKLKFEKGNKRYKMAANGISPLIIPGTANSISKVSSYEHDEFGYSTEEGQMASNMQRKRAMKKEALIDEMEKLETVKTYGKGDIAIITWGSAVNPFREALKYSKDLKIIQPVYLEPFPKEKILKELKKAKAVFVAEYNESGQLSEILKREGIWKDDFIQMLKFDGRPFNPKEVALSQETK
jgi:2-oxoglutarate ferredoxin oxidoreductase subunit alpha